MSFITEVDIMQESKECFLTFAEEVLTDRAIPSAEDGLLSSQRKLIWTMEDYLKMNNKSKTKKCNAIVGQTLATSYYHGDAACYGVLCKMSQEFLMRYPLIHGQGGLGTQESNEMVASSRYTEAKPSIFADLMMEDYGKDVVPTKETYNGEFMEPVVLPSLFPNALCNGKQAIGVSMAHNSLPNNLTEICNAIIHFIEHEGITIDELLNYVPGPDFPLDNIVINQKDVREAFRTGKSSVSLKVRGRYEIKDNKIIFTSIPYRTYRDKIKEQITKNIEEFDKIIDDFNDESGLGINKLIFTVKKDINPEKAVLTIFKLTDLQTTVSYNMNYIVNGTPKLCSLIDLIEAYYNHQTSVLINSTQFDKDKAEKRLHILQGLKSAVDKIDAVIALIRESKDKNEARNKLINFLNITEIQANAILDMKLSKLTKLDAESIDIEIKEKEEIIKYCNRIIEEKKFRDNILIDKIITMRNKYGDDRRTELCNIEIPKEEKEIETVIPEDVVVVTTENGYIKKVPKTSFRTQNRGGKGVKTQADITKDVIRTNTIDNLLVFSSFGKLYKILVDDIPTGNNTAKGVSINSLIPTMDNGEKPVLITSVNRNNPKKYIIFVTKNGMIKKTSLEEYKNFKKKGGIIAIKLKENDAIADIAFAEDEDVLIITKGGYCIRFNSKEVGATGRATVGVKAIKLNDNDEVIRAVLPTNDDKYLGVIYKNGLGKKVDLEEFTVQGRAGKGIIISKNEIADATLLNDKDSVLITSITSSICITSQDIPTLGRAAAGNTLIKNGNVISISRI